MSFRLQAQTIVQKKTHLPSREVTEDKEHRNKIQKEDQEICSETPLEAKAGVSEVRTHPLDLAPFKPDKRGLAGQPSLPGPCILSTRLLPPVLSSVQVRRVSDWDPSFLLRSPSEQAHLPREPHQELMDKKDTGSNSLCDAALPGHSCF